MRCSVTDALSSWNLIKVTYQTHHTIHYCECMHNWSHKLKHCFTINNLIYLSNTVHNEYCYARASIRIYLVWNDIKTTHRIRTPSWWRCWRIWWSCWSVYPTTIQTVKRLKINKSVNVLFRMVCYISN